MDAHAFVLHLNSTSCTEVALSDRQQLNILSDDFLYSKTFPAYNNFKSQSKLITGT